MKPQRNISENLEDRQIETERPIDDRTVLNGQNDGDVPSIPALNHSMPIEVMRDFDAVLLFGRLAAGDAAELTIAHVSGEADFPDSEADSAVLVRGYDAGMNPVLLRGKVLRSSASECTVGEMELIPYSSQRKQIRYPVDPPADICLQDDAGPCQPQSCHLHNISTGGACIVSEYPYKLRQQLSLRIGVVKRDSPVSYCCQVVRVTPRRGAMFEYGLLFIHMDERERACLMQDIQAIRKEMGRKMQDKEGHI